MNGLSICIPIYNFNCIESIKELCRQIQNLSIKTEILVIDDASAIELADLKNFENKFYTYKKLINNIGRSKIRNLLAKDSKFSHILYLDGDSDIPKDFIEKYTSIIKKHPNSIICGGRKHNKLIDKKNKLRYKYAIKFEEVKASDRNRNPYHSFMSNNFICPKHIIYKIPFNEKIITYGHEDTFFGYELKKNNAEIIHIDNPVTHLDIDTNNEFIIKTKHSIKNLIVLKTNYPEFIDYSKLLILIEKFKFISLKPVKGVSKVFSKLFQGIASKTSSTYSFQLFKLFYAISLNK